MMKSWFVVSVFCFGGVGCSTLIAPQTQPDDPGPLVQVVPQPKTLLLVTPIKFNIESLPDDFQKEVYQRLVNALKEKSREFLIVTSEMEWAARQKNQEGGLQLRASWRQFDVQVQSRPVGVIRSQRAKVEIVWEFEVTATKGSRSEYQRIKKITLERGDWRAPKDSSPDLLRQEYVKSRGAEVLGELEEIFSTVASEIRHLASDRSWEGRVAYVQGSRVYLNVGEKTGLRVGDILKVTELGDEVFDPQSGEFIGRTPGRVKGTLEVIGFFGEDGSVAIIHSGGGFKENDRVSLDW